MKLYLICLAMLIAFAVAAPIQMMNVCKTPVEDVISSEIDKYTLFSGDGIRDMICDEIIGLTNDQRIHLMRCVNTRSVIGDVLTQDVRENDIRWSHVLYKCRRMHDGLLKDKKRPEFHLMQYGGSQIIDTSIFNA